jgi:hypothetical protein
VILAGWLTFCLLSSLRQPITAQHDLAREIRVERYEGDVVAARDQGSHLRRWGGAGEPSGSCDRLVE